MIATQTFDSGGQTDFPSAEPPSPYLTPPSCFDLPAAIEAILQNESLAFEEHLRRLRMQGDPRNAIEESLLDEIAHLGLQLDRVKKAHLEQIRAHIESTQEEERDHVHELGTRLFHDRMGPSCLYGNRGAFFGEVRTSWPGKAVDPDDPAVLVQKIQSTRTGCVWLRNQWALLLERLEPKKFWQSQDRFKCFRLLGYQPIHACTNHMIADIFVASAGLEVSGADTFADLMGEMERPVYETSQRKLRLRFPDLMSAFPSEPCRQFLLDLVNRNIEELNARIAQHDAATRLTAERTAASRSFDHSADGERLRNFETKCRNQYFQAIQLYSKIRGRKEGGQARPANGQSASEFRPDDPLERVAADGPQNGKAARSDSTIAHAHRPPGRTSPTTSPLAGLFPSHMRPLEDPERLKELAEPIGEMIRELLAESPTAFEYLRPYLPPLLSSAIKAPDSTNPADASTGTVDEKLKADVRSLGELIRELLAAAPQSIEHLRPYLPAPTGRHDGPENPG
jgi:hypothetical protein